MMIFLKKKIQIPLLLLLLTGMVNFLWLPSYGNGYDTTNFTLEVNLEPDSSFSKDVTVTEETIYIASGGSDLKLLNASSASNYALLSIFTDNETPSIFFAKSVESESGLCYLGAGEAGFYIINATDPTSPVQLSNYHNQTDYWGIEEVYVEEQIAYLASHSRGCEIVNVSDPLNPQFLSLFSMDESFSHVCMAVSTNIAVIGFQTYQSEPNVFIFNISDLRNPIPLASFQMSLNFASKMAISNNFLYILSIYGVRVVDISNPSEPIVIGTLEGGGYPTGIHIDNNIAYVLDRFYGIEIINISNPREAYMVAYSNPFSDADEGGIWGKDREIYCSYGHMGTLKCNFTGQWNQSVETISPSTTHTTNEYPTYTPYPPITDPDGPEPSLNNPGLFGIIVTCIFVIAFIFIVGAALSKNNWNTENYVSNSIPASPSSNPSSPSLAEKRYEEKPNNFIRPINTSPAFCGQCGTKIEDPRFLYCSGCGAKLDKE